MEVRLDVQNVLTAFHAAGKPIGLCCIAPVLAARVFKACTITLGCATASDEWPYAGSVEVAEAMGATHVEAGVRGVVVDKPNKLVTSPAYMNATTPHNVFMGIGELVAAVLKLA